MKTVTTTLCINTPTANCSCNSDTCRSGAHVHPAAVVIAASNRQRRRVFTACSHEDAQ